MKIKKRISLRDEEQDERKTAGGIALFWIFDLSGRDDDLNGIIYA